MHYQLLEKERIFAADNIDLGSDYGSFHGADLMVAQDEDPNFESLFPRVIYDTNQQCRSFSFSLKHEIDENIDTTREVKATLLPEHHPEKYVDIFQNFQERNVIWLLITSAHFKKFKSQVRIDFNMTKTIFFS